MDKVKQVAKFLVTKGLVHLAIAVVGIWVGAKYPGPITYLVAIACVVSSTLKLYKGIREELGKLKQKGKSKKK